MFKLIKSFNIIIVLFLNYAFKTVQWNFNSLKVINMNFVR